MFHRITVGLKGGILRVDRERSGGSGAIAAAGGWCSWLVSCLSCPWGAVGGGWVMFNGETARLCDCRQWPLALACLWASGFGPSVRPGRSGIRSPSRGRPSSSSVCLHWVPWTCLCQCTGGGGGGQQHSLEDPGIIAFGGGGGGGIGGGP